MSETRINTSFYYDPIRQGYDTNLWHTMFGVPIIGAGTRLITQNAAIIHYADVVKGEFTFNLYVPDAPGGNDDRVVGLYQPNTGAYIVFVIGQILSGDVSDGSNTATTGSLPWDTAWTGVNTNFKIRWEAGTAKFFVSGTQVGAITNVAVPAGPLSLYISDVSGTAMSVGDITAQGVQSYVLNAKSADTTVYGGAILMAQAVSVTENVLVQIATLFIPSPFGGATMNDSVTVSENLTMRRSLPLITESVTITESKTLTIV